MSKNYDITMDEQTYRVFAECGRKMNCGDATELIAMAVESLAQKLNMDEAIQANKKFIDQCDDHLLHPADFEGSNAVFGPPPGQTEEEVYSLCAAKINWGGAPSVLTCWKPTHHHLKSIKKTGRIWLAQMADRPNPVCLSAKNPLEFQGIELQ